MVQWLQSDRFKQGSRLLRSALALALVVLLGYLLASLFWLLWYGPQDPAPDSASLPRLAMGQDSSSARRLSNQEVAGWQLFGVFEAEQAQPDKPTEAPDTRLQLSLLGVFQSTDPARASAIIGEQRRDAELYRIGDRVPGNAVLEEVYADRVILRRAGNLETLRWSEEGLGGVSEVPSAADNDRNARAQNSRQRARSTRAAPPAAQPDQQQEFTPESDDLAGQRQQIVSRLGLEQVSEGGNEGYRLGQQAPRELLQQVGLRPSDVVVSVNGIMLGSESSDMEALRSYQETQRATIVVQRGNQQFTVNFPP